MTYNLELPKGFDWCGGCGSPLRALTALEAHDLIVEAHDALTAGFDPLEVLAALEWPAEMMLRSRTAVCSCPPPKPSFVGSDAPSRGFHLYRLWAADDRLLYVGVSSRLRNRLRTHSRRWGDLIDHATWEEHPDEASMLDAERDAVRDEDPALNKALT